MCAVGRLGRLAIGLSLIALSSCRVAPTGPDAHAREEVSAELDLRLRAMLLDRRFTGRVEETLESRLGRSLDPGRAELGRLLFFDPVLSLTEDNGCAGCHGPNAGFGGAKSIAIGVDNNGIVGPGRLGPRNLRRAPSVINAAFYPTLMWDSRIRAPGLDPFDDRGGFRVPAPVDALVSQTRHLLAAQAFTPVVAREEMAGFDFVGDHAAMLSEIAERVDAIPAYRQLFASLDPDIAAGRPVAYADIAAAVAEFEMTLVRADAPIDAYARGDDEALSASQKRGAILFFGVAMCGECHTVRDYSNEMFSDFDEHVLGVPQIGATLTNATFDGPGGDEDFGVERDSGDPEDRYRFRTSPLRNALYQPSFMHNGAYRCLDEAITHHVRVLESVQGFDGLGLASDLHPGPMDAVLAVLHELVENPPPLTDSELADLAAFVGPGLADPDAHPDVLRELIPGAVPSGLPLPRFELWTAPDCA